MKDAGAACRSDREFAARRTRSDDEIVGNHCFTCGDVAVELTVLRIDEGRELALCEGSDGQHETVEIALVAPVSIGDRLLVHAGTAIAHSQEVVG
jgi:hydrogenase maturation factor